MPSSREASLIHGFLCLCLFTPPAPRPPCHVSTVTAATGLLRKMHLFIIHFILSFLSFNGSSVFLIFHDTGIF